jgi:lipoprotein-anchoring transpeptidase ErfK/SrfK
MKQLIILLVLAFSLALNAQAQRNKQPAPLSEVQLITLEIRLAELGYWIDSADGMLDERTHAAVAAFRRVNKYQNLGDPNTLDLRFLRKATRFKVKSRGVPYFQVDLRRQILFFVDERGNASLFLPISTGSGETFIDGDRTKFAITPRGTFTVFYKRYGWHETSLGQMYYPSYIIGGVAIHGSSYVADYPRTHGCIAVPLFAAEKLSELMPVGTVVVVIKQS